MLYPMSEKTLILLRGLPGSGKTSTGKDILNRVGKGGVLLSTNDFFRENSAIASVNNLEKARRWNVRRAGTEMKNSEVIIVDDIHSQSWEMLPYVRLAVKNSFGVQIIEPETPWLRNAQTCYTRMSEPTYFTEEEVIELSARWDHSLTNPDQLIAMINPTSMQAHACLKHIKTTSSSPLEIKKSSPETPINVYSLEDIQNEEIDIVDDFENPLTLFELCYIALTNIYHSEDLDSLITSIFSPSLENPEPSELVEQEQYISLTLPAKVYNDLTTIFYGSAGPNIDDSYDIQCQVPVSGAWELYSHLCNGQFFKRPTVPSDTRTRSFDMSVLPEKVTMGQASSNLKDIMEEQLSHHWIFLNKLEALGLNETTFRDKYRLSLQLLSEKFVSIGRPSIEEIFVENKCDFNLAYSTLCLLTSESPSYLTKDQEKIVADENRLSFAFIASSISKSSAEPDRSEESADRSSGPLFVVRKTSNSNSNMDCPQLKYDEKRHYTQLPKSIDHFQDTSAARIEALELKDRKRELVATAKRLHARGMHEAAAYYSAQIRDLRPHIIESEKAAALDIIQQRNVNLLRQNYIDLHGLKVREALKTLDLLIDQKMRVPTESRYLYVVTGTGKHSDEGRAKLRPAVVHYLRHSRKLSFTLPHNSVVKIDLHSSPSPQMAVQRRL